MSWRLGPCAGHAFARVCRLLAVQHLDRQTPCDQLTRAKSAWLAPAKVWSFACSVAMASWTMASPIESSDSSRPPVPLLDEEQGRGDAQRLHGMQLAEEELIVMICGVS